MKKVFISLVSMGMVFWIFVTISCLVMGISWPAIALSKLMLIGGATWIAYKLFRMVITWLDTGEWTFF